jgi:dethiobiotin synthetase
MMLISARRAEFMPRSESAIFGGGVMLENGVIVVGTDTGIGKTFVAAGLLCALRRRGVPALPMKPVQTGATTDGRSPDLEFSLTAARISVDAEMYDILAPYRFPLPASPHLAAREAGKKIDPEKIRESFRRLRAAGYVPVVEAAGGLLVPLTESLLQIDLLTELGLPFVLVARAGLGTLNHTLLSIEALRQRGARTLRLYLNSIDDGLRLIEDDNARILSQMLPDILVRRVERLAAPTPEAAACLFSAGDV